MNDVGINTGNRARFGDSDSFSVASSSTGTLCNWLTAFKLANCASSRRDRGSSMGDSILDKSLKRNKTSTFWRITNQLIAFQLSFVFAFCSFFYHKYNFANDEIPSSPNHSTHVLYKKSNLTHKFKLHV